MLQTTCECKRSVAAVNTQELLQRYTDTSPAVRVAMLGRTPQLAAVAAAAAPDGGLERQVLGATRARLHDLEDKVRAAACR